MPRLLTRNLWLKASQRSSSCLLHMLNASNHSTSPYTAIGRQLRLPNELTTNSLTSFHTYSCSWTASSSAEAVEAITSSSKDPLITDLLAASEASQWNTVYQLGQALVTKSQLSEQERSAIESVFWSLGQSIRNNDKEMNKRAQVTVGLCDALEESGHSLTQKQCIQLIQALGRLDRTEEARGIFRTMQQSNKAVDTRAYNIILAAHRGSSNLREALAIFAEMRRNATSQQDHSTINCQPNLATYNILISLAAKSGEVTLAEELREDMTRVGIHPDTYSFTPLIQWYTARNQLSATRRTFKSMKNVNVTPTLYLWNILLSMYARLGRLNYAQKAYKEMTEAAIKPDAYSFVALIKASVSAGDLDSAVNYFYTEMPLYGVQPNVFTFGAIMDAYARANQWSEVENLSEQMKTCNIRPNAVIYAIRIRARAALEDTKGAQQLFDDMLKKNIQPDAVVYAALIEAYASRDDLTKAMQLFETMQKTLSIEHESMDKESKSMAAHLALVNAFIRAGDLSTATSIYQELRETKIPLTTWHYNALLKAFMSVDQIEDIDQGQRVFNDMRRARVSANAYTYTILFDAYGKRGDLSAVRRTHQHLVVDARIDPDIAVWNALMDAYQRNDQPVQVVQIWRQLVHDVENNGAEISAKAPIATVDPASISIILDTCGWHYYPWLARRIWGQLPALGVHPNTNNYVSYIECLARIGDYQEALRMFKQVPSIDPSIKWPNYKIVATLAGLLRQNDQIELLDQLTSWIDTHHPSLKSAVDPMADEGIME
ncbi:hypothetical protein BDF19DRAFT_435241 [Syncephalis fuscata]|nr:hypothetical protein BDF19DRAFT_435241 [Syncephalis fuscata]